MVNYRKTAAIEDLTLDRAVQLAGEDGPLVLTRRGKPAAALLTVGELERLIDERELLRRLALGELESAAGEGDELAEVVADCRLLLEEN